MTSPSGLDCKVASFIIGVDSLFGGDALHRSGTQHFIADTYFSGMDAPAIYHDAFSKASRDYAQGKEGAKNVAEDADAVKRFVDKYGLRSLRTEIECDSRSLPEDDRTNVVNLASALDVMLRYALSTQRLHEEPSFAERYLTATAGAVDGIKKHDPKQARIVLREELSSLGFEVSNSRNLRETYLDWRRQKLISPEEVAGLAKMYVQQLMHDMRERLFARLNFPVENFDSDLSDVSFDGHRFETVRNQPFTGSSIYQGGTNENGMPALRGLLEYNVDHPITDSGLIHLMAHEMAGHYVNSAIRDLLWRSGRLGFLSTMQTMCTPETVFQEGWAQNVFELIYGNRQNAAEVYGDDLAVELASIDLEDYGKHNGAVMLSRGKSIEEVKQHIAEDCVQPDEIVEKLSRWAKHPIIGAMYGPAYLIGREEVNRQIAKHGPLDVARVGFALDGAVDIQTFIRKLNTSVSADDFRESP